MPSTNDEPNTPEHVDVIVVGAGLSGIGAGCHLGEHCPDRSYLILEAREDLGGTWDLFRYPGIRSDSDMHTFGYSFAPWTGAKALADGPAILAYLRATATEHGVLDRIRFRHRVLRAQWSTKDARWTIEVQRGDSGDTATLTCSFLYMCSGYYNYEHGYTPPFPGVDAFRGTVIHPQQWPEDVDYTDKRIVVIGSGATAVTLVPALAAKARHVTMLQRTPTYIVSMPGEDRFANRLKKWLPKMLAYRLTRSKNVLVGQAFYQLCQRAPGLARRLIVKGMRNGLGADVDVDTHFNPPYEPWDQRLCFVPDADLFSAIRSGKATVVTDRIKTFTATGLDLESGEELEADIIVTATGLDLEIMGGADISVDGKAIVPRETMGYKAMMFSDVPNMALCFGYTNASWTLKADLTSAYVCRLLNYMRKHGHTIAVPRRNDPSVEPRAFMNLKSGYIERAAADLPRAGSKAPWRLRQNYLFDLITIRGGALDDGVMEFGQ